MSAAAYPESAYPSAGIEPEDSVAEILSIVQSLEETNMELVVVLSIQIFTPVAV